jgi:hypothetical protein
MTYGYSSSLWSFGYGGSAIAGSSAVDDALTAAKAALSMEDAEAVQALHIEAKPSLAGVATDELSTVTRAPVGGVATTFDGVNQRFESDYIITTPQAQMSCFAWVKYQHTDQGWIICQYRATDSNRCYGIQFNAGGYFQAIVFGDGGGSDYKRYRTTTTFNDGLWHSVGFTFDAGDLKLWVDGVEQSIAKTVDNAVTSVFAQDHASAFTDIGSQNGANLYTGQIQLPSIWEGSALTDADVLRWHSNQFSELSVVPTKAWHLDGADCTTLHADVGNITAYNSPTSYSDSDVPVNILDKYGWEDRAGVRQPALMESDGTFSTARTSDNTLSSSLGQARSNAAFVAGTCSTFDSVNQKFSIGYNSTSTDQISVASWVKLDDPDSNGTLMACNVVSTSGWRLYGFNATNLRFQTAGPGANNTTSIPRATLQDREWHSIVVTYSSVTGKVIVYIDGSEVVNTSGAVPFAASTSSILMGSILDGSMQLPAIWDNTVLTPAEVSDWHSRELDLITTPTKMWHLDGDTCWDVIDGTNHGTAVNNPAAGKQDVVHWNLAKGFAPLSMTVAIDGKAAGHTFSFKIKTTDNKLILMHQSGTGNTGKYGFSLHEGSTGIDSMPNFNSVSGVHIDGVEYLKGSLSRDGAFNLLCDGEEHDLVITMGSTYSSSNDWGLPNGDTVNTCDYPGFTLDTGYVRLYAQNGSAPKFVNSIPNNATPPTYGTGHRVPAMLDGSSAADGGPITFPAIIGHNNAESKLDFTNGGMPYYWLDELYSGGALFDDANSCVVIEDIQVIDFSDNWTFDADVTMMTGGSFDGRLFGTLSATRSFDMMGVVGRLRLRHNFSNDGYQTSADVNALANEPCHVNYTFVNATRTLTCTITNTVTGASDTRSFSEVGTWTTVPTQNHVIGNRASGSNAPVDNCVIKNVVMTNGGVRVLDLPLSGDALDASGQFNHGVESSMVYPRLLLSENDPWSRNDMLSSPQTATENKSKIITLAANGARQLPSKAGFFNGYTSDIQLPAAFFDIEKDFTFAARVTLGGPDVNGFAIVSSTNSAGTEAFAVTLESGIRARVFGSVGSINLGASDSTTLVVGQEYHIVVKWYAETLDLRLWVDGVLQTGINGAAISFASGSYLGAAATGAVYGTIDTFHGLMRNVSIQSGDDVIRLPFQDDLLDVNGHTTTATDVTIRRIDQIIPLTVNPGNESSTDWSSYVAGSVSHTGTAIRVTLAGMAITNAGIKLVVPGMVANTGQSYRVRGTIAVISGALASGEFTVRQLYGTQINTGSSGSHDFDVVVSNSGAFTTTIAIYGYAQGLVFDVNNVSIEEV